MADKAAERIKYKTEVLKLLLLLTVAIGGGSLGLVLGTFTPLRAGLATGVHNNFVVNRLRRTAPGVGRPE